jgi:hypothetical protein
MKDDHMPYTINFLDKEGIVEIVSFGKLTIEDFINQGKEAIELALKKNTNLFLADDSDIVGPVKISVIISLPDFWERFSAPRTNRMAVLISKDETLHEDFNFFENVCINRGWNVKLFDNKEDAIEWLLKDKQAI